MHKEPADRPCASSPINSTSQLDELGKHGIVRFRHFVSDSTSATGEREMTTISDKIMRRVVSKSKRHERWVCTPTDFPDIGSRTAVNQALSRLVKRGDLRRVGRGLYDKPRYNPILKGEAPANVRSAVEAIVRRDGIRVMRDGIVFANMLRLTNAVPAHTAYVTDGATRNIQVDGRTIRLRHAGPNVMRWFGKPSAPVAQALRWLGPLASQDKDIIPILKRILPDDVKRDLIQNSAYLPPWAETIAQAVAGSLRRRTERGMPQASVPRPTERRHR